MGLWRGCMLLLDVARVGGGVKGSRGDGEAAMTLLWFQCRITCMNQSLVSQSADFTFQWLCAFFVVSTNL